LRGCNVGITDLEGYVPYIKCAVEMSSGTMTHISNFIKIGSETQKLLVRDNRAGIQIHRGTR
jgi:hypothetical protein